MSWALEAVRNQGRRRREAEEGDTAVVEEGRGEGGGGAGGSEEDPTMAAGVEDESVSVPNLLILCRNIPPAGVQQISSVKLM